MVFALAPYVYFRRRYANTDLDLRSVDRRSDALVILVIMVIESAFEVSVFRASFD